MQKVKYKVIGAYSGTVLFETDEKPLAYRFLQNKFPNDPSKRSKEVESMERINRSGHVLPQPMKIETEVILS